MAHADPGPVGLQLGRLGPIPAHLDRVATVSWEPMELVDAEVPDLTALQLAADDLHRVLVDLNARGMRPADSAEAVDLLQRLTPPTLAEALAVLGKLCNDGAVGPHSTTRRSCSTGPVWRECCLVGDLWISLATGLAVEIGAAIVIWAVLTYWRT
jgi:hypothetical protein